MCTLVFIKGREEIATIAALRDLLAPAELVFFPGYDHPLPGSSCLCPVDVPASAAAARFACEDDPAWGYRLMPPTAPATP